MHLALPLSILSVSPSHVPAHAAARKRTRMSLHVAHALRTLSMSLARTHASLMLVLYAASLSKLVVTSPPSPVLFFYPIYRLHLLLILFHHRTAISVALLSCPHSFGSLALLNTFEMFFVVDLSLSIGSLGQPTLACLFFFPSSATFCVFSLATLFPPSPHTHHKAIPANSPSVGLLDWAQSPANLPHARAHPRVSLILCPLPLIALFPPASFIFCGSWHSTILPSTGDVSSALVYACSISRWALSVFWYLLEILSRLVSHACVGVRQRAELLLR